MSKNFLFSTGFLIGTLSMGAFCHIIHKHDHTETTTVKEVTGLKHNDKSRDDWHRDMVYPNRHAVSQHSISMSVDSTQPDDAVCVEQNCRQDAWMMTMRFGSSEEKIEALNSLAILFYENGNDATTIESLVQNESMPEADSIRELLLLGIGGNDEEVADAAFSLLKLLPEEDRGIVMSRAISDDNFLCRVRILSEISQNNDNLSITTMMHALDDSDEEIKETASRLLENTLAMRFSSGDDAFSWWEENASDFKRQSEISPK